MVKVSINANNNKKKTLVTSALPYVNNVPHLGTMVCIISADVYTRFLRLKDEEVISVLGTDEHGTTTETIAMKMNMTPKQAVDHFYKIHKEVYDWFNCEFDCFGRTSSPENTEITQDIFKKLKSNGFIVEREIEQMFDQEAKKFLSDRFIEGTCPFCGYEDARGDQCDKCGKLLNPTELKNPRSKLTGSKPVVKKTKHLFIALDELQPKLEEFVSEREKSWSENTRTTTNAWLKEGLKERAITRDLEWGIKVPEPGYEHKVFYVWFDAPIGYVAITKANRKDWKEWWHNPENVRLVQFMGKDNIPFHTILFPASLIGADDNYTLVDTVDANEYLNYEDDKFSKSRGVGVFGDNIKESGIPADAWRYYIIINRPEKTDTKFTWLDLQEKINSELVANLGNLVNRTLTFINKFSEGKIGLIKEPLDYSEEVKQIISEYEAIELKKALKSIMNLSKKGNQYFQENEPWIAIKENPEKAHNSLAVLANLIKDLSILIEPVMPETSKQIQEQLAMKKKLTFKDLEKELKNHKIGETKPLFKKIEDKEVLVLKEKYAGKQEKSDNLSKIDFRVAKIVEVKKHPEAEKLYIEKLDLGKGEERTIVSGLVPYYKEEELLGKNIIIIYNLKPAMLRGILSKGMLLAASQGKDVGVLIAPNMKPGDRVKIKDIEFDGTKEITVDDFFKNEMVSGGKNVMINGIPLEGKIVVDKGLKGKIK